MVEDDLQGLRQALLSSSAEDRRAASQSLESLAKNDHQRFIEICHGLLNSTEISVRSEALRMLAWFGDRDDALAEASARQALDIPELRSDALSALGTIGTAAVVPLLFEYVERDEQVAVGSSQRALMSLAKQVRTDEQRQQALALARKYLCSEVYYDRDAALRALSILSTAAAEEELLLTVYHRYHDELVVWALGGASRRMLPALQQLLAEVEPKYAEHQDIAHAIERMQIRLSVGEEADPGRNQRVLSKYL